MRSERWLCEEVHLNLAYRWFCRLGPDGEVPGHSTFSRDGAHRNHGGGGYFFFSAQVFGAESLAGSAASDLRSRDAANSVKRRSLRGGIAYPGAPGAPGSGRAHSPAGRA